MKNSNTTITKILDIDAWVGNSKYKVVRRMPRFLLFIVKSIVCQNEINEIHNRHIEKMGIDYVSGLLKEFEIEIVMHNEKALQKTDRCIFVANHPLGGIDAMSFLYSIFRLKGKVISPSNQFFNYVPNLRPLIVGVNVFGGSSREQARAINEVFASDDQVMLFPAGLVSRKTNGKVRDLEWHKSFVCKAMQTQRYVVPTFISEINSKKFYRIARWRKFFGIKIPIEVLYLPQEMLRKRKTAIHLVFGDPIPCSFFDKSKTPQEWAQYVRGIVYDLENEFRKSTKGDFSQN